ncbi:AMP-binding protein [Xenorhabdus bovienii]|uniref:AMP-binding protein n=1 Tax=Xenorhabdus bovienii TaxID=40576 RepID=UPI001EDE4B33|nr:AMP-binding protein [Xenorhabdus bovienii]MCG3462483.1 AMP-binding protein [Xenorhabdus bovienii]
MSETTLLYCATGERDVINTLALCENRDTRHRIYYRAQQKLCSISLAELDVAAMQVAHHLYELGVRQYDRIGIMAHNQIEWVMLDLAILKLGAVTAGFEPGRFDTINIRQQYGLKYLFVAGNEPFMPDPPKDILSLQLVAGWVKKPARSYQRFHTGYDAADICAIKFTSGSTGAPKGLEATVSSINSSMFAAQSMFTHQHGDNVLVFLRLALLQQRYWIYSALVNQHNITLSQMDDVLPMSQATFPTVIMGVPGFYAEVKTQIEQMGLPADGTSCYAMIQNTLGGKIRYLWTGSAPASPAVLSFFNDNGVPLYEGYGLNETCIVSKNHPGAYKVGSVGKVLPNKCIRFDQDGVLIVSSRHPVNCRYTWCAPGTNEKTYLPTGEVKTYDVGYVDEEGFLYIQGRVDDILTLNSGRNVLVRPLEEKIAEHPHVHTCVLYGNGQPYITALISPAAGVTHTASLTDFIAELNTSLLPEQQIKALVKCQEPFSINNGLLTSQFKPKRQDIYRRYAAELTNIYRACYSASAPHVLLAYPIKNPSGMNSQ